jgi:hypothetical protein
MGWLLLALRRLRDDLVSVLATGILVLVSAFLAASVPVVLGRVADDALRAEVIAAAPADANLELLEAARIPAGTSSPLDEVAAEGSLRAAELPAGVRSIVRDRTIVVETPRWAVTSGAGDGTLLAMRIHEDAEAHLRITDGRAPTGATEIVEAPAEGVQPAGSAIAFEAMVAAPTARRMNVRPGDLLLLGPDLTDPLARGRQLRLAIRLVGTFEVTDRDDPFWLGDRTVAGPGYRSPNADTVLVDATALISPDAYPALLNATSPPSGSGASQGPVPPSAPLPFRYTWRLFVDPDRLDAEAAPGLLADLRRAQTIFPSGPEATMARSGSTGAIPFGIGGVPTELPTTLATGLPRVLVAQLDAWRSTSAILTVAAAGPAGIAIAALGLLAVLSATGRRQAMAAWYRRGARGRQVVVAMLAEVLLVGIPAVAIGLLVAALVAGGGRAPEVGPGGFVLLITILLVSWATLAPGIEPAADRAGRTAPRGRRRVVLEVLVLALAAAATVLIRERGVGAAAPGGAGTAAGTGAGSLRLDLFGIDPLVAAAPVLVGLAVALVTVRIAWVALRVLASAAARRRDLVPVLAFRRSTRAGSGAIILIVLLTSAAIASFSLAGVAYLSQASRAVAWHTIGADYLVAGPGGGQLAEAARNPSAIIPTAAAVAIGARDTVPIGPVGDQADLLALSPDYARVIAGTPNDPGLPAGLLDGGPTAGGVLPGIVSSSVTIGREPVVVGDTVVLSVRAELVNVRVVAVLDAFPSLPAGDPFVVVALPDLEQAVARPLPPSLLYVRAPDGGLATLERDLAAALPGATIGSRTALQAALDGAPLVRAVSVGLALAAVTAVAYAALGVIAALALAGAARAAETAHLRALGLGRRQRLGLVLLEQVPIVVVASVGGMITGYAFFVAVLPGLKLGRLVGASGDMSPMVGAGQILALLGALTVSAGVAILAGTFLEERTSPMTATRRGIE